MDKKKFFTVAGPATLAAVAGFALHAFVDDAENDACDCSPEQELLIKQAGLIDLMLGDIKESSEMLKELRTEADLSKKYFRSCSKEEERLVNELVDLIRTNVETGVVASLIEQACRPDVDLDANELTKQCKIINVYDSNDEQRQSLSHALADRMLWELGNTVFSCSLNDRNNPETGFNGVSLFSASYEENRPGQIGINRQSLYLDDGQLLPDILSSEGCLLMGVVVHELVHASFDIVHSDKYAERDDLPYIMGDAVETSCKVMVAKLKTTPSHQLPQ